jgi:hypothetical protein
MSLHFGAKMTALNWDKDKARRMPKEQAFDDLPPVGSFRDQRRCGVYPIHKSRSVRFAPASSDFTISNRVSDFEQLDRYVRHAQHPDFKRRIDAQKIETIRIIRRLIIRCVEWGHHAQQSDKLILSNAQSFIDKTNH